MNTVQAAASRTRPKNRRDLILRAAAELFRQRGYQAVGIDDIGEAVGITGPAVYRHFRNKEDLLMAAVHRSLDRTLEALRTVDRSARGEAAVATLVGKLVATTMQDWDFAVVFRREVESLPPERRAEVRPKLAEIVARLTDAAVQVHGEMSEADLALRMEAQYGLLAGVLTYGTSAQRRRYEPFVARLATAAVVDPDVPPVTERRPALLPAAQAVRTSRREIVLAAAAELFAERSYAAVGIDEAGVNAGITGPSVYRHFVNKEALLVESTRLLGDTLTVMLGGVLALDASPPAVLEELTHRFVDIAYDYPDLFVVYFDDGGGLRGDERQWYQQHLTMLFDEWEALLRRARPELVPFQARAMAYGVIGACTRVAASVALSRSDTRAALHALLTHVQLRTPDG